MAVLTFSEIKSLAYDRAAVNVTTDAPVSDAEFARFVNEALADVWAASGGRSKLAASATAWAGTATLEGVLHSALTDVEEIVNVWPVATADLLSISCTTASTTTLASTTAFGSVKVGMIISGTGIPANTVVTAIASTSSLTMSNAATDSTTNSRTFTSVAGVRPLEPADPARIRFLRGASAGHGTYSVPQLYASTRASSTTAAEVNKLRLDYWPSVSTAYSFPIEYIPQFTPIDASTVTTPDVNDIESRDVALLTAAKIAPLVGRAELVPSILADVSDRTAKALERKFTALLDARADK